jgi:hypothetical protein
LKCRISNGKRRSVPDATCPTTGTEQDNRRKNSSSPFADNYPLPAHNHTIGDFPGTQRSKILSFPGNRPYSGFDSAPDRNMDAKGHFSLRGPGDNRGPQGAVPASWGDRQVFASGVEENATSHDFQTATLESKPLWHPLRLRRELSACNPTLAEGPARQGWGPPSPLGCERLAPRTI